MIISKDNIQDMAMGSNIAFETDTDTDIDTDTDTDTFTDTLLGQL
jgi:hypothetical protein